MMRYEVPLGEFRISTDPSLLQISVIHAFLSQSYWAESIPVEVVAKSIENSLCFGVYEGDRQIGFARAISDYATFAYVADVFILEPWRGRGLSKSLMRAILADPQLQGLRRLSLVTLDAHGLYRQFGFTAVANPDRHMEKVDPDIYRRV